jgi:hypothetical protein
LKVTVEEAREEEARKCKIFPKRGRRATSEEDHLARDIFWVGCCDVRVMVFCEGVEACITYVYGVSILRKPSK